MWIISCGETTKPQTTATGHQTDSNILMLGLTDKVPTSKTKIYSQVNQSSDKKMHFVGDRQHLKRNKTESKRKRVIDPRF